VAGTSKKTPNWIKELRAENTRLRGALHIARQWMPIKPVGELAKHEVEIVDKALGYQQKAEAG